MQNFLHPPFFLFLFAREFTQNYLLFIMYIFISRDCSSLNKPRTSCHEHPCRLNNVFRIGYPSRSESSSDQIPTVTGFAVRIMPYDDDGRNTRDGPGKRDASRNDSRPPKIKKIHVRRMTKIIKRCPVNGDRVCIPGIEL